MLDRTVRIAGVLCLITFCSVCRPQSNEIGISFMTGNISVEEDAGTVQVRLMADGKYETPFTVDVRCFDKFPVEAKVGTVNKSTVDVYPQRYTVEFNDFGKNSSMSTPLTINIVDDPLSETRESFICLVFQPRDVPGVQLGNPRSLEISIVDNDMIFVRFNSSNLTVDEDAGSLDVYFEVVRQVSSGVYVPAENTMNFQVRVRTVNGTATGDSDFEMKKELMTFPAGQQFSTPFSVKITDDTLYEGPEQFNISYSINSSSVRSGANVRQLDTTATVVINDNDAVSISFEQEEYYVVEGNNLLVRLNISGEIQNPFTVVILPCSELELNGPSSKIGPGDNNATSGADFSGVVISVTFRPGMMQSSEAVIKIVNNNFLEGPEKFELCFRPTDDYERKSINRGDPKLAVVTIIDDPSDAPLISLKRLMVTAREGSDDVVNLTVCSDRQVSFPFHVFINLINKTAKSGTDFVGDRIRVDFAPFQTSVVVSISLIDDNTAEKTECFTVRLEVPPKFTNKNIIAGNIVKTQVTIVDDDCVTVTMATKSNISEGGVLPINVSTVMSDFQYSFSVSVVATNGSATGGVDFDNSIFSVRFDPNGARVQVLKLRIFDDKLNEKEEKFTIHLQRQTGNTPCYKIENGTRNVTIIDDDAVSIFFEQERYSVVEGHNLPVHLNISGAIQNPFTVDILPCSELELNGPSSKIGPGDNNATIGADFSGAVVPVTFQPGMMQSSIAVINIVNDNLLEGPEKFELCFQLTEDHDNRRIDRGDPELAVVTITDDPPDGVCVSMSVGSYPADEDDGGITVTIETDKQSFVIPFDVILTISDRFVPNNGDLPTLQYTVTIPAGETSVDHLIEVNSDFVLEGDETFVIILQPTEAASDVLVSTCTQLGEANITIINDDMEIEFTAPQVTVVEREGPAEFCVERRGDIRSEVDITVSTDNITGGRPRAEAYLDYTPLEDMVVTFPAGVARVCFNVEITDDDVLERPTSVCDDTNLLDYASVGITNASTPQATGWRSSTVELVIEDDDVEFEFSQAQCSSDLSDNSRRIYTCVKLCGYRRAPAGVIVTLQTSEGDPVGVEGISARLNFTVNSPEQCANLTLVDDDRIEMLETFNLDIQPAVSGNRTSHQRMRAIQCAVTSEMVLVSFETSATEVKENIEHLQLRLKSRGQYSKPFQVSFACMEVHPVEARDEKDFTGGIYTVNFTNTSSNSLTSMSSVADITIVDDEVSESTESFFCVLLRQSRTSDDGVVVEDPDTIAVAIEDNDLLSVSFENISYSGEEGGSVEIRLLASSFERPFQVQIILIDLDPERNQSDIRVEATTGVDYKNYTLTEGEDVVRFGPSYSVHSTPLSIPLLLDNIAEGTEYFALSFVQIITGDNNPIIITPVDPVQAIVGINDTNEILVRFNSSNFEIDEDASSLNVYFEVVHEVSTGVYVPAEYTFDFQVLVRTVNGTANGSDFQEKIDSAIFEAGEKFSTPFSIQITDDNISEGSEQFNVSYSINSSSVRSGANVRQLDTTATVVINDNDAVTVNLQTRRLTVTEGVDDTVNLTVQANASVSFQFYVIVVLIDKTAKNGTDFVGDRIRVDFAPFQASVDVSIPLIDDNTAEEKEKFKARLEVPPEFINRNITAGGIVRTPVFINDDDCVTVTMEANMTTVSESDTLLLKVTVDDDFDARFTVSIASFNGSAISGVDFNGSLVSVDFDPYDSVVQPGIIMIYDDELNEEDETFTVQLQQTGNSLCLVIENGTLEVTIRDENVLTVGIENDSVTVREGVNGSVDITVVADIQASFPFHVFLYPVNGTAESGTDFVGDQIRVDFAQFQTSVDVSIRLIDDNTAEEKEWFTARLEVPTEFTNKNITAGGIVRTEVSVNDDDCVNVTMVTDQTVQEADILVLNISVHGDFDVGFNISVAAINGSAVGGVDFNNTVFFVHFDPNGAKDHEIRIEIFADDNNEEDEIFSIQLQRISEDSVCYQFGNNGIMDILIDDNTQDPVTVGIVQNQRILSSEGERITLNIYRIGAISKNLSIEIQIESNSARKGTDYRLLEDFVVFNNLQEALEIIELTVIKLLADGESEEEESLVVTLAKTPGVIYIQQSVVVTIRSNKT